VFAQAPLSGARVLQGTPVRIRIAEAPPKTTVIVPDLLHGEIGSARALLAEAGLQLGDSAVEEGDAPPNSVISQSPQAGTTVERGSSVNVVVAQPVPAVEVPNLVNREEAEAVSLLTQAGLQMGAIREQQDPATSGTVLAQSPQPRDLVHKGTAVDVVVSREVPSQLSVLLDRANPEKGELLTFHALIEPVQIGVSYRFEFGDGQSSNWQPAPEAAHTFNSSGNFSVQAFARTREASLQSAPVTVSIPGVSPGIIVGLSTATLVLAFGGFVLHGRRLFRNLIRVVPAFDSGMQQLSMDTAAGWGQAVQVRIHQDPGVQSIHWSNKDSPRKADRP
jgi:PASTA domain/PKD domain